MRNSIACPLQSSGRSGISIFFNEHLLLGARTTLVPKAVHLARPYEARHESLQLPSSLPGRHRPIYLLGT